MHNMSYQATDELVDRLEEYRRSKERIPSQSEIVRNALDEFLPELDGDGAAAQEAGA